MGTFLGHVAPGTFFISFGLWWLVRAMNSYYSRKDHYVNGLTRQCCCKRGCLGRLPLDSWVLIVLATLGVCMEIITSLINVGIVVMGNRQHVTMYIAFGLVGLISILVHHKFKFVPKGAEYMALIIALVVEMVLFAYHLHGKAEVEVHIHMLLVYTIAASVCAVALELHYHDSINAGIARGYFTLLQGTWFCQIAFILYPPGEESHWNLSDMENIMVTTLLFAWHMIGCLIVILVLGALTYRCCSVTYHRDDGDETAALSLLADNGKSYHMSGELTTLNAYQGESEDDGKFPMGQKGT